MPSLRLGGEIGALFNAEAGAGGRIDQATEQIPGTATDFDDQPGALGGDDVLDGLIDPLDLGHRADIIQIVDELRGIASRVDIGEGGLRPCE